MASKAAAFLAPLQRAQAACFWTCGEAAKNNGVPATTLADVGRPPDWLRQNADIPLIVSFLVPNLRSSDEDYELCNRMSHRFSPSLPHRLGVRQPKYRPATALP
jgi:hypothetical protein